MFFLRCVPGLVLAFMMTLVCAQDFKPIPPLQSHVTDTIGMLNASQRATLDNVLKEYEARTGSQIAVLLVASTEPEAIEQYGIRVADAWKLGRKGVDDGVILIVAKNNPAALRRLRIEAGRGVQGTLTDAQSKRILQDVIAPHFRQNDFYGGLAAGISALTSLLDREHLPAPAAQKGETADDSSGIFDFLPLLFIALVVIGSMVSRARGGSRNALSSNGWGQAAGIILGSAIGSSIGNRGGGFGGGGSGGGFSGGGGGFDGGGASGDW